MPLNSENALSPTLVTLSGIVILVRPVQYPNAQFPILITLYLIQIFPFVLMFGWSVPAYFAAKMLNKYFKKLEEHIMEAQGLNNPETPEEEDDGVERIFSDQLDESLAGKRD